MKAVDFWVYRLYWLKHVQHALAMAYYYRNLLSAWPGDGFYVLSGSSYVKEAQN